MNKILVHYNGTADAFKAAGLENTYTNSIVFISGSETGFGAAVYTHGKYYASFDELFANLTYFSSISDGTTTATATGPNKTIVFSSDDNSTVEVIADSTGIKIGIAKSVTDAIAANTAAVATKVDQTAFDELSAKVTTINSDYLTSADKNSIINQINIAQSEAIATAADDAALKADTAEANAKEYTDSEIAKLDSTTLKERVDANTAAITVLNGDDAGKTARAIASEVIAEALIPENAVESLDTLEEIAAWIQQHPNDVATMNASIQSVQNQANGNTAQITTISDKIEGMDLEEVTGYVTKISQENGNVSATAIPAIPATDVVITDTDNYFAATNAEAAFAELANALTWEEL